LPLVSESPVKPRIAIGSDHAGFPVKETIRKYLELGFPLHFVTLLGVWKVLGGIAILVPGFARVKEWAYAAMFFDLTGAAIASGASGNAWWHVVASLAVAAVLAAS
jgi:uncharacterized membrane protein